MSYPRERLARALAVVLALLILASPGAALAQTGTPAAPLSIPQATLMLWPEYDDPGLLVIYAGTFDPALTFPQAVAFPIAAGAREIQATYSNPTGQLLLQDFTVENGKLLYTLPGPTFHIEYYVDRPPSGNQRSVAYNFASDYPIGQLEVQVQQPARATDFALAPAAEGAPVTSGQFTVHSLRRTNVMPGQALPLTIGYTKTDQSPSVQRAQPTAAPVAAPVAAAPAPATSFAQVLPYILIGVGVAALLGAAGYWFVTQRQPAAPARGSSMNRTANQARQTQPRGPAGAGFCPQCGRPYAPADQFCAQCGAARRK